MSEVKYENGRSIRLFLMDGEPNGRYQAECIVNTYLDRYEPNMI